MVEGKGGYIIKVNIVNIIIFTFLAMFLVIAASYSSNLGGYKKVGQKDLCHLILLAFLWSIENEALKFLLLTGPV